MSATDVEGRCIRIRGTVQGVGFRPWIYRAALACGINGDVHNDAEGVTINAFGDDDALRRFVDALAVPPPAAHIDSLVVGALEAPAATGFAISESNANGHPTVSIPPDLATCDECVAEIFDPANRRYRYPFTNCTNCGPRFTIATGIPYDRPATTMARFEMCDACRREYENPADRRFHAQPNACPACGPRLTLRAPDGARIHVDDVVTAAAGVLRDGLIVAVKGIGGFHLACDARSDAAVRRLRERKHRDEKPFAVMVRDLAEADAVAQLTPAERSLLASPARPIVLARRKARNGIAESVAPHSRLIGVLLPYSPLHHLLLADAGGPLVMTSGNRSDEPICFTNEDALKRLGDIADVLVLHDREIRTRCDDSVAASIGGTPTVVRRSRGYVPRPIDLARALRQPALGCGALLKNTFCLGAGSQAWLGPHIGDLENAETFGSFRDAIERMERFLRIEPSIVAHDMHPEYMSTTYARRRAGAQAIAVQHHHAHVVSAMAEHRLDGPAIGIAYDGTGYGSDGTIWGGEVLLATAATFERLATFRPLPLVGGDYAIRAPWRIALALVMDAFGEIPDAVHALCAGVPERTYANVVRLLAQRGGMPMARGVGRYFDAFAALFLGRAQSSFEGQLALAWDQVADPAVTRTYRFDVRPVEPCLEIDFRPTMKDALADFAAGSRAPAIAAAFHNTLIEATAAVVRAAAGRHGRLPVVASGGCFQNARLAEGVRAALAPEHEVLLHEQVPPGDGGIALGQIVVANAVIGG